MKRAPIAERAAAELLGGRREDRALWVLRLGEIFEAEEVRERRGKHRRAICERLTLLEGRGVRGGEFPGAVAGRGVLEEDEITRGGREPALFVNFYARGTGAEFRGERRPIEAEVRRHAGVGRDAR